jgi:hypothetical protein
LARVRFTLHPYSERRGLWQSGQTQTWLCRRFAAEDVTNPSRGHIDALNQELFLRVQIPIQNLLAGPIQHAIELGRVLVD